MRIVLREKRQITVPAEVCDALGLKVGDSINIEVQDGSLVGKPGRKKSLDALEAIQKAISESGVTEEELLEGGRQIRREMFIRDFPELAKHLSD